MFNGFSHSVMGASHVAKGIVCQDSSAHKITDRYAVAVVADGHGSKKHFRSNIGSQCAVEATIETIERFYENADDFEANFPKNHKRIIRNIERQIVAVWNSKVMKHLEENPVTVVEKKPFKQEEFELHEGGESGLVVLTSAEEGEVGAQAATVPYGAVLFPLGWQQVT